jgi:outer membrane protein assembly factor BamD
MAHYRQMEKPDRDRTQARDAEDEFQTFLQKYPNDPLAGKAEQHLREVQEVLAEGDYRIGYFYFYTKEDKRAAASRLISVVTRYPLYSKADHALWMLGNIWEGSEKKDLASPFYARIVRDYPLSPLAPKAKERLTALKAPVPQADPKAVAWMTAEQNAPRPHESFVMKPLKLVQTNPKGEFRVAARTGKPTMTPESDNEAGVETLSGGSRIGAGPGSSIVVNVTPGGTASAAESAESVAPAGAATEPKAEAQPDGTAPAASDPNAVAPATGTNEAAPKTDGAAEATSPTPDAAKTDAAPAQDATKTESKDDKKKESSSKKKKGLKKLVPW